MRLATLLLTSLALPALAPQGRAQAFCALRDPNRQIYELFPEADSYRSIVRTVGDEARQEVSERLPFTLHFNELGRHTLYAASREKTPLGFVHVRSEAGRWGLVEIAWALDLDLRVVDFTFQRCRDRNASAFDAPAVRAKIIGADFDTLRAMLDRGAETLKPGALPVPEKAAPLGAVLVRNALKTLAATESAWGDDLWQMRVERRAEELAPGSRAIAIGCNYGVDLNGALEGAVGPEGCGVERPATRQWEVFDREGEWLGRWIMTRWQRAPFVMEIWWRRAPDGSLAAIEPQGAWPEPELAEAFAGLVGSTIADLNHCATAVELVALEALITSGSPPPSRRVR